MTIVIGLLTVLLIHNNS